MKYIKKSIAISNAKIQFISLVDKAANKKQFLVTKSKNGNKEFSTFGKILKAEDTTHYITGIVYEPMTADTDDEFMTEEEIRKAAYWFAKNSNKIDIQHDFEPADGTAVVESYIAPCDMEIGGESVIKGSWIMTVEVTNADVWDSVQKKELTGFSMGGVCNHSEEETNLDEVTKNKNKLVEKQENTTETETKEKVGAFKKLAGFLGFDVVEKGAVLDKYQESIKRDSFWKAFYALQDVLHQYDWENDSEWFEQDEAVIREAISEFSVLLTDILKEQTIIKALKPDTPIIKAGKKISNTNKKKLEEAFKALSELRDAFAEDEEEKEESEESEVTKAEVQAMIDESVVKAVSIATEGKKTTAEVEPSAPAAVLEIMTGEAINKMVTEAVAKSLEEKQENEPLTAEAVQNMVIEAVKKAVEPVLKARNLPNSLSDETENIQKSDDIFNGLFY